jgi:hypothetical protein
MISPPASVNRFSSRMYTKIPCKLPSQSCVKCDRADAISISSVGSIRTTRLSQYCESAEVIFLLFVAPRISQSISVRQQLKRKERVIQNEQIDYKMLRSIISGFLYGFVAAVVLVFCRLVYTKVKQDYHDISQAARFLQENNPTSYNLLYRAKQHSVHLQAALATATTEELLPGTLGARIRGRLRRAYKRSRPGTKYLILEEAIIGLNRGGTETEMATFLKRCHRNIRFLDQDPTIIETQKPPDGLPKKVIVGLAKWLFYPVREGPTENKTSEARLQLKLEFKMYLDHVASKTK